VTRGEVSGGHRTDYKQQDRKSRGPAVENHPCVRVQRELQDLVGVYKVARANQCVHEASEPIKSTTRLKASTLFIVINFASTKEVRRWRGRNVGDENEIVSECVHSESLPYWAVMKTLVRAARYPRTVAPHRILSWQYTKLCSLVGQAPLLPGQTASDSQLRLSLQQIENEDHV